MDADRRGKHFVVEVVKQSDYSPLVFVSRTFCVTFRARAHRGFDSESVFTQAIALCVFTQQFPGFGAIRHEWVL